MTGESRDEAGGPPAPDDEVERYIAEFIARMGKPMPGRRAPQPTYVEKTIVELLPAVPDAVAGPVRAVREARAAKERAVDAHEYEAAAAYRDAEKAAVAERSSAVAVWAAEAGARALADDLLAVHEVVGELASLLRAHGIALPVRSVPGPE